MGPQMTSHYQVGASKIEILLPKRELPLMGYGDPNHRARESKTPLFVRTVLIEDPITGRKLAMCCLEIILITEALRMEILKRTGLKEEEILLTATHTHCAPGGHSNYVMYASITDGFHDDVFQSYVTAVIHSINKARTRIRPARIHFQTGEFHPSEEVAFNRSIRAWNQNTDTEKYSFADRHLAVDREMKLLRFEGIDGNPIASWNWFGVHATSMHRDYFFIHSDNKGLY